MSDRVKIYRTRNINERRFTYWINEDFINDAEAITGEKRESIFQKADSILINKSSPYYDKAIKNSKEHDEFKTGMHQSLTPKKEQPTVIGTTRMLVYSNDEKSSS